MAVTTRLSAGKGTPGPFKSDTDIERMDLSARAALNEIEGSTEMSIIVAAVVIASLFLGGVLYATVRAVK
jgi:hypothetical protein